MNESNLIERLAIFFAVCTLGYLIVYFSRRYFHYRTVRKLADAIADCVHTRGFGLATSVIAEQSAIVFGVDPAIIRIVYEGGNWVTIVFQAPVERSKRDLLVLTQQVRAFLPTWANYKLLTTDDDPKPKQALSPVAKRRQALIQAFAESDERDGQGGNKGGGGRTD